MFFLLRKLQLQWNRQPNNPSRLGLAHRPCRSFKLPQICVSHLTRLCLQPSRKLRLHFPLFVRLLDTIISDQSYYLKCLEDIDWSKKGRGLHRSQSLCLPALTGKRSTSRSRGTLSIHSMFKTHSRARQRADEIQAVDRGYCPQVSVREYPSRSMPVAPGRFSHR